MQDCCYHGIVVNNINNNDDSKIKKAILKNFNYYDGYNETVIDGTILHNAVEYNFTYYSKLLVNDGFDYNVYSKGWRDKTKTPFDVAKDRVYQSILILMEKDETNEESKQDTVSVCFVSFFLFLFVSLSRFISDGCVALLSFLACNVSIYRIMLRLVWTLNQLNCVMIHL